MTTAATFWWLLTLAALGWYCTVTVYVAIKGGMDIKEMLKRLDKRHDDQKGD